MPPSSARSGVRDALSGWLRRLSIVLACMSLLAFAVWIGYLDYTVRRQFSGQRWELPSHVYARPVEIYAGAHVSSGAKIGRGTILYPGVFVGEEVRIGEECILYSNVTVREGCRMGNRVILHAGAVIGADGFGFALEGGRRVKIPQVGIVEIGDDVEIGANTTIDRATLGVTRIASGVKIDNLVQIGHNTVVGADTIIVAQTGISGSCRIGSRVVLGGQVGVADHVTIGDGAQVGAQSGVHRDVAPGGAVLGAPAIPAPEARRTMAALPRLPELLRAVRTLERRVAELERRFGDQGR